MRRRSHIDANQPAITKALRQFGASVEPIHTLGKGIPDLLVGFRRRNLLFEVKNPEQPANKLVLTPDEYAFMESWAGQYDIVLTVDDAIRLVKEHCR